MNDKKRHKIKVSETHVFWGYVEIEAESEEEAREIAAEEFQVNWSDSELLERDTQVLTEDGAARASSAATQNQIPVPCEIAIRWSIEDVQEARPDLTDAQACEVLAAVEHQHDRTLGVTWDTLKWLAEYLFGDAPDPEEDEEDDAI